MGVQPAARGRIADVTRDVKLGGFGWQICQLPLEKTDLHKKIGLQTSN